MFSDISNSVRSSIMLWAAYAFISPKRVGISRIEALRIVRLSLTTWSPKPASEPEKTGNSVSVLAIPDRRRSNQSSTGRFARQQFSNDTGSGAGSNYNLGRSGLKRFHGRFQLRPHA